MVSDPLPWWKCNQLWHINYVTAIMSIKLWSCSYENLHSNLKLIKRVMKKYSLGIYQWAFQLQYQNTLHKHIADHVMIITTFIPLLIPWVSTITRVCCWYPGRACGPLLFVGQQSLQDVFIGFLWLPVCVRLSRSLDRFREVKMVFIYMELDSDVYINVQCEMTCEICCWSIEHLLEDLHMLPY